jgi:phospholipid transport system substrate-binding protein
MNLKEIGVKRELIVIIFISCVLVPFAAFAGTALETVKGHTDKVLEVLGDPALKPESAKEAKKERLRAIAMKMFDFAELSRRTLAGRWNDFSPEQQRDFIELYRSLLEDAYAAKLLSFSNEKIVLVKEVPLTEKTVEVQSTLLRKTGEIPIYFRAILKNGVWRVYDVVVEGVSLVTNYRSQFKEILSNKPPESLIEALRKKLGTPKAVMEAAKGKS